MLPISLTPFPVLATKRLTLRKLMATDEEAIFALRSDTVVNKFLARKMAASLDDARLFIHKVNDNIDKQTALYWAITYTHQNEPVGTICLFCFSAENKKCEIGFELLTDFQRQGIMQEAVAVVIDYAFNTLGVKTIEAFFHSDNQRSKKLLEKCFFKNSERADKMGSDLLCYYLQRPADHREQNANLHTA